MLPMIRFREIVAFVLEAVTSPKKLGALAVFFIGFILMQQAIGLAQDPDHSVVKFFLLLAGGFIIGSGGAIYFYWLQVSERSKKDMGSIAVETLSKQAELERKAQESSRATPWRESRQSEPHETNRPERQERDV